LASISAPELAQEILDSCLSDGTWSARTLDALVHRALDEADPFEARAATKALFGVIIERLGDLFEPDLCEVYARLFSHVIARVLPDCQPGDLLLRYHRVRQLRRFQGGEVNRVYVLSRVTLGADVAVTSVVLDAAKSRFPDAEICLIGPGKNAELFADDPRIVPIPVVYGRGSLLQERLSAAFELKSIVDEAGAIVIDPDSRLTQLGLIPVCDDARYYFFESRAFGDDSAESLPALTAEWISEVFDIKPTPHPYAAPKQQLPRAEITVSLGVGDNLAKRLDDEFELQLLQALLKMKRPILLDRGAGGEETERVNRLAGRLSHPELLQLHDGSYASFASHILQSKLYVGYDSAGQHVAAAGNVPLVSIFAGFACERMFSRWRPTGPRTHVIRVEESSNDVVLADTVAAIWEAAEVH
jgi:ADP-heptose:LPS heptosyltransferase